MFPTPIMPTSSRWATGAIGEKPIVGKTPASPWQDASGHGGRSGVVQDLSGRSDNRAAARRHSHSPNLRFEGVQACLSKVLRKGVEEVDRKLRSVHRGASRSTGMTNGQQNRFRSTPVHAEALLAETGVLSAAPTPCAHSKLTLLFCSFLLPARKQDRHPTAIPIPETTQQWRGLAGGRAFRQEAGIVKCILAAGEMGPNLGQCRLWGWGR
jgi:hypothetical protein